MKCWLASICCLFAIGPCQIKAQEKPATIRVATYNISFYRDRQGKMAQDLSKGDPEAERIAEVLRRVQPDIVLLNEFDYEPEASTSKIFRERYLQSPNSELDALALPHAVSPAVNTGEPTGIDLDNDRRTDGPGDAFGWGRYPGQYGMTLLSRFPMADANRRTFQRLLWKDMPEAKLPTQPGSDEPYYSPEQLAVFRLSSKTFMDVSVLIETPSGPIRLHLLCSHPTPPVFDGPEDRNGLRNHDEIRLLADYIDPERSEYLVDDRGKRGGLAAGRAVCHSRRLECRPDGRRVAREHPTTSRASAGQQQRDSNQRRRASLRRGECQPESIA